MTPPNQMDKQAIDLIEWFEGHIQRGKTIPFDVDGIKAALTLHSEEVEALREENARWRASHAKGEFNPDWCAAQDALAEHLEHSSKQREEVERLVERAKAAYDHGLGFTPGDDKSTRVAQNVAGDLLEALRPFLANGR